MTDPHPKLAKYLAHAGVASRRAAELLIAAGKVEINGKVEKNVATRVDMLNDAVSVDGKPLAPVEKQIVLSFNKPVGVVSTTHDPDGKKTILDLLPQEWKSLRLYPVGRLDEESEGLILLTNNGELANRLTHPKFKVLRTYQVWISGELSDMELYRLRSGVQLKDAKTQPATVLFMGDHDKGQIWEVILSEGMHHQIRRMMQALNHRVIRLVRTSHGRYELGDLRSGEWREEAN